MFHVRKKAKFAFITKYPAFFDSVTVSYSLAIHQKVRPLKHMGNINQDARFQSFQLWVQVGEN